MNFQVKKIENCFAESETYEYLLPLTGREMLQNLADWEIRINEKLRRPVIIARKDDTILKCMKENHCFRVSFPQAHWASEKQLFEAFLEKLPCSE